MKKFKFDRGKMIIVCVAIFIVGIIFSKSVFATELEVKFSEEFEKWNSLPTEQKQETLMPKTYSFDIPEKILNEYVIKKEIPYMVSNLLGNMNQKLENVSALASDSRYSLADNLDMRIEHQGSTGQCWAFSMVKALETNIALKKGTKEIPNFSERHMDYATTETFEDGINPNGYHRELKTGGLPVVALGYLTNGTGAVLEEDMPFEDNEDKIELAEIEKEVDTIVTEYNTLPSIHKTYEKDENGNTTKVIYKNSSGFEYTADELEVARAIIKQQIIENGAIPSVTAANVYQYYNIDSNTSVFEATNYNCNSTEETRDHAITIVGWDDNYSKDNFVEGAKPSTNGAYIVLNTYGEESFENGYIYISYEDYFIETELYSIANTTKKDYENIYQSDFYGGVLAIGTSNVNTGYYANTFAKNNSNDEYINSIGVTVCDYVSLEIYVNPNDNKRGQTNLIKVAETDILEPGYHRIDIDSIKIDGEEFTIVVKQKSISQSRFYFSIETPVEDTAYENVKSDNTGSYSIDGVYWFNLDELEINGLDMTETDVCIKAFVGDDDELNPEDPTPGDDEEDDDDPTLGDDEEDEDDEDPTPGDDDEEDDDEDPTPGDDEDEDDEDPTPGDDEEDDDDDPTPGDDETEDMFNTEEYLIEENNIYKIPAETTIEDFKSNIETNLEIHIFYGNKEITNENEIVKNGMILKTSDGKEYELIVSGDLNCDGKITLTDVSKIVLHYNENTGYILTGAAKKATDMNLDGETTLTDVSQMILLYNSI